MNRLLLVTHEGAPVCWRTTQGEVRERIAQFAPEDADLIQVWSVFFHDFADKAMDVTAMYDAEIEALRVRSPDYIPSPLPRAS